MKLRTLLLRACLVLASSAVPFAATAEDMEQAIENFRRADVNGDILLTYAEFATLIDLNAEDGVGRAAMVRSRNLYTRAFKHIDSNNDDLIAPEEPQAMR